MTTRLHAPVAFGIAAALLAALAGCNDNDLGPEKRKPNQIPQTILSSGPPDSTYGTNYKVHLFWSGSDPDGTIDHYDFILVDHPAANDSIAATDPSLAHQVIVQIPGPEDPRWTATFASDTLIVTKADTLRVDPAPPPGGTEREIRTHNDFVRMQSFERWHTFFVRAVDNEGLVDQTPEYRSFNSRTLAPTVFLLSPVDPKLSKFQAPRTVVFNWDGSDDTGEGVFIAPIAARWTIVKTHADTQGQFVGYPDTLYRLPPSAWRPWVRWDARDKSGRQAIIRNLQPAGTPGDGFYLFAVQVMDEAGAVTPIFDAHTLGKNNTAKVFVNDDVGAKLIVEEKFLGAFSFVVGSRPVRLDVAAGQPIRFKWRGDASSYGGEIVAYRYGWNISDPTNDQLWEQGWCATCRTAPVRVFNSGTQRFFLECRDNAETITHAEFELVVHQVTRRLDFLFVDDSRQPQGSTDPAEAQEDQRWQQTIDSLLVRADARGQHFDFDRSRDWYDVVNERQNFPPPLATVFNYKTIVWTVVNNGGSAINTLADFVDPFVQATQTSVAPFNYLSVYVDNGGEFWLMGDTPAYAIFTKMNSGGADVQKIPVNITNWDDRGPYAHPDQDSVGTGSFLYRLGVEAVDLGSGSRATPSRQSPVHGCLGLIRATPQGFEHQQFESSVVENHSHVLILQTSDVDQPPAGGVTYTTEMSTGHTHQVNLTQEQLRTLASGNPLRVQTTESPTPVPHSHEYTLVDQVGLWGAPAKLERDDGLWPLPPDPHLNPYRSRANVEIYNMPVFMAQQSPPLEPEAGISVVLYNYESATPYDVTQNPPGYPRTADGQPVVILRKATVLDPYYSRCIAGFEPWRLSRASMLALADNILLRQFRLGIADEP